MNLSRRTYTDLNFLKVIRMLHGFSQEQLARKVGRSQGWLSKVENGKLLPQREQAEKMAEVLKHDLVDLLHAA